MNKERNESKWRKEGITIYIKRRVSLQCDFFQMFLLCFSTDKALCMVVLVLLGERVTGNASTSFNLLKYFKEQLS